MDLDCDEILRPMELI